MITQAEKDFWERRAQTAAEAFSVACRDPDISKDEFEKLRRQYLAAMQSNHAAHGYG